MSSQSGGIAAAIPFLLAGLSGCLGPGSVSTSDGPPASWSADPRFSGAVPISDVRSPYGSAFEAFVSVNADGSRVLACLHGMFKEPSLMFVSTDGGASFRELHADPSPYTGGDCEAEISPDGDWYFLHSTIAGATIVGTSDEGRTWRRSFLAAPPTNGMADRPWLVSADDKLFLSFMPLQWQPGAIGFTKSVDKAVTWSSTTWATQPSMDRSNVLNGHLTVSPIDGTIRIPFATYAPTAYAQAAGATVIHRFAVSRDGGATWIVEDVPTPASARSIGPPAATYGLDGSLYWAFTASNGSARDVQIIRSLDEGRSWEDPLTVLANTASVGPLWIDARPGGVDVLFQGMQAEFNNDGPAGLVLLRVTAGEATPTSKAFWLGEGNGEFVSVDHDAAGRAFVAFVRNRILHVLHEV